MQERDFKHADLSDRTRAELHVPYERQLAPLGCRAMSALSPKRGDHIIDIGCGAGQTSVALGEKVGPEGAVLGIDLAPAVLDVARARAKKFAQVRFVQADAQIFPFGSGLYDAAFSRFGVMFFADPVAAFTNIRRALKAGGRVAFVCWRSLEENALDTVPLQAAYPYLPPQSADPRTAAPFSFSKSDTLRDTLGAAGFADIEISAHDEDVGTGDLDSMLELTLRVGSLGKIVRESPQLRSLVLRPVQEALAACDGPRGPMLNAAIWVVKARSPTQPGEDLGGVIGAKRRFISKLAVVPEAQPGYDFIIRKWGLTLMHVNFKNASLLILAMTAVACSKIMFAFFQDPEGANLLVVTVMAAVIYAVSSAAYLSNFYPWLSGFMRSAAAIFIQMFVATGFYLVGR